MKPNFIDYINASWLELDTMIIEPDLWGCDRPQVNRSLRRAQDYLRRTADLYPKLEHAPDSFPAPPKVTALDTIESIKNGNATWYKGQVPFAARLAAQSFLEWHESQKATPVEYRVKQIRRCRYFQCQRYFIPDESHKLYCSKAHQQAQRKAKDRCRKRLQIQPI